VADISNSNCSITRSAEPAHKSEEALRYLTAPRVATTVLAHIRAATVGGLKTTNCHPFAASDASGREWVLMHKGTIFDYEPLSPYFYRQSGSSDSERVLLYFIDQINAAAAAKGAPLSTGERFAVFEQLTCDVSPGNCLNLVAHDEDALYVYSNYRGALNCLRVAGTLLLSTSPLAVAAEALGALGTLGAQPSWEPLVLCTPFLIKEGEVLRTGAATTLEYVDSEYDTRFLNLDYSAL
jgi:glutamine amidotransferase